MLTIESYLPAIGEGGATPNTVLIKLPNRDKKVRGLLDSDVSVSFQNRFGSLIPDMSSLSDVAQILNMTSLPAWIGASAQAWKSTDPIRFGVSFYLIRYREGLPYEDELEAMAKLCTLSEAESWSGGTSSWTVTYHGGYSPNILRDNAEFFDISTPAEKGSYLETYGENLKTGDTRGTISLKVGNHLSLSNLLLTKLDVTSSIVEVPEKKPLYYRVDMQLQTCRAALSTDVEGMFG